MRLRRFIPTCVGTTQSEDINRPLAGGSSPRAWGLRSRRYLARRTTTVHPHVRGDYDVSILPQPLLSRFIPTCVGTTSCVFVDQCAGAVHPHVRVDYGVARSNGTRRSRFIPTCVGTTFRDASVCSCSCGSSPRAWGLHFFSTLLPGVLGPGSILARASSLVKDRLFRFPEQFPPAGIPH